MAEQDLTHRRLGGFYFFYFAYLGAYTPFFTLYLLWVGRSAVEIGVLMALPAVARIVAPHLWGWLADAAGRQTPLLRATTAAGVVCFFGVFAGNGFHWLFAVLLLMSFQPSVLTDFTQEAVRLGWLQPRFLPPM